MTHDITVSDLDIMTGAINYRRWLFSQVSAYVGRRVFEIGAGVGNYTEFLLDSDCVVCLEIHSDATARLRERFSANSKIHIYQGDIADPALRALYPQEQWISRWGITVDIRRGRCALP